MTPDDKGWHVTQAQVADYVGERSTVAQAASVETHLTACRRCRSMLDPVLPDLPIDRMWHQVLVTVDSAPAGWFGRAVERMKAQRPLASFAAAALRPRLIVITATALLFSLTLAIQATSPFGDKQSASGVAASRRPPESTTSAPNAPSALQIGGSPRGLVVPGPEPAPNDGGTPATLPSPGGGPGAGVPVPSPLHPSAAPKTRREPQDDIPWRSGYHPD